MATKPDNELKTYGFPEETINHKPRPDEYDVRLLIDAHPQFNELRKDDIYGTENRPPLEYQIRELLMNGYTLASFNTVADGSGDPTCVALMIKVPR
jgi:hypothetical protein